MQIGIVGLGRMGAGMMTDIKFLPIDVSFAFTSWLEIAGGPTGFGGATASPSLARQRQERQERREVDCARLRQVVLHARGGVERARLARDRPALERLAARERLQRGGDRGLRLREREGAERERVAGRLDLVATLE